MFDPPRPPCRSRSSGGSEAETTVGQPAAAVECGVAAPGRCRLAPASVDCARSGRRSPRARGGRMAYLFVRFLHFFFAFSFVGALVVGEWNARAARRTQSWDQR